MAMLTPPSVNPVHTIMIKGQLIYTCWSNDSESLWIEFDNGDAIPLHTIPTAHKIFQQAKTLVLTSPETTTSGSRYIDADIYIKLKYPFGHHLCDLGDRENEIVLIKSVES